jgi:ABC-type sugar transport system substrate-binding protein
VHVVEGQWTEDSAHRAVLDWFRLGVGRNQQIRAIVCQNDAMAGGARRALLDHGAAAQVPLLGCDGLVDEGQRLVRQSQLAGTIVMPKTSGRAIDLLSAFWERGERADVVELPPTSFPPLSELRPARG